MPIKTMDLYTIIDMLSQTWACLQLMGHKAQLKFVWAISIPSTVAGSVLTGIVFGGILMVMVIKKTYRGNVYVVQFA